MNSDYYYSVDRLVEFGMSMAIAQQMVHSMNTAIAGMRPAGFSTELHQVPKGIFYVMLADKQVGPLTETELSQMVANRQISKETYVWKPGMPRWSSADNVPEVLKIVALCPPPFEK